MRDLHQDLVTCELFAGAFPEEELKNMEEELVAADPHRQAKAAAVQFARNAREGWPEAIREAQQNLRWWHDEAEMCQKAERERDELKKRAEQLEAALETAIAMLSSINWDSVDCPKDVGTNECGKCVYDCGGQDRVQCWKTYFLALAGPGEEA